MKTYISASDTYHQACINDYVTAQKAQADKDKKPMDAGRLSRSRGDKITANQATKQKGSATNYDTCGRRLQESPSRLTSRSPP